MAIFNLTLPKASAPAVVGSKDVDFIDYDGTIVYSYTASEFTQLTAMPANPSHDGLTAQGWNWSLSDAKTYVASYGKLIIGQMYTTTSGATEIDIELHEGRLALLCSIGVKGTVTIDWGDGSTPDTITGTSVTISIYVTPHTYTSAGSYTIKLIPNSGTKYRLAGYNSVGFIYYNATSQVSSNAVKLIRIGAGCSFSSYAFKRCYSLASVTIPNSVTSINDAAFYACPSLASVTIPSSVTSIGSNVFSGGSSLKSQSIPNSIATMPTSAFVRCYSLASVTIPNSVTSINDAAFYACPSLASVTIPSSVTSIGSNVFSGGSSSVPEEKSSLGEIHFKSTTPPTVANSNAWTNIPTDCKIYVPAGKLSAYTSATNYPSSSTYTYIEE